MSFHRKQADRRRRARKLGRKITQPLWTWTGTQPLSAITRSDLEVLAPTLRFLSKKGK